MSADIQTINHHRAASVEAFITGTLTVVQQIRVENAVQALVAEKVLSQGQWNLAFEIMSYCVIHRSCFVAFRNRFNEKLLAIQQAIRKQGLDALWNKIMPQMQRSAA